MKRPEEEIETPIGARKVILRKIRLQREITVIKDERRGQEILHWIAGEVSWLKIG